MRSKDFIYGRIPIIEHLESGGTFEQILLQKGMDREVAGHIASLGKQMNVPVQIAPHYKLDRVTRKNHQGVIGFTAWVEYRDIGEIVQSCYERAEVPLILMLDRITDVRNVGAIARSAEVMGVSGIVMPMRESAMINADAVKTSAGAIMKIPLSRVKNLARTAVALQAQGLTLMVADHTSKSALNEVDFIGPTAIIMGSEGSGVDPKLAQKADIAFRIPQVGITESLNVSVATGVILYEALRQRKQST